MPGIQWHFREFRPGDNVSDPDFARALFSRDDESSVKSIVREAVQNSLDARDPRAEGVSVRFAVRTGGSAAEAQAASQFFDGLWKHISSDGSGLGDPPGRTERVPYLVVEDFGTRGLVGDPATWDPFDAVKNSFFLFFRALGRSGKEGEDRGRWGVGKFVFPMSSRAHCLLAVSVREDDPKPLAMGRVVLKTHRVGNVSYHPDGHWGSYDPSGLVLPATEADTIRRLSETFDLHRSVEPGLSVVVPWIPADINSETLLAAVAGEYFLPILRNELTFEVDHNGVKQRVDAFQLMDLAGSLTPQIVRARVELGVEAATWPSGDLIEVSRNTNSDYEWLDDWLDEGRRTAAASRLENGDVVGFRVHTRVRPKSGADRNTYFDVFLRHAPGLGRARPLIIREGITIAEDATTYLQDEVTPKVDPIIGGLPR